MESALYTSFILQFATLAFIVWGFFDERVGRTPALMAGIGLLLCVVGITLCASISSFEHTIFVHGDGHGFEFISQVVNAVMTAVGGSILAASLVLRATMANQVATVKAQRELRDAREQIADLLREHKELQLDASFLSPEQASERSTAIWNLIEDEKERYVKANRLLAKMGLNEASSPYPDRQRSRRRRF